ncbi:5-bromo-4-chloroindolyl phosphate hydrolysis family protein [Gymnodinialimonas ceratoperidinii]|uniref:5-bromo-4-chloroindolyl phosphate hydrolysis family protein n=1 Tax=Gymnodinialimonas ceratoperidinii TaxID=2856823 RepID=A0A8F6YBZ1_9RHOB|nr:5-bromo-4-chloroindolyl phosphate hydrolysis family protein [Gymnodinialimonas ceratoperidinii]QXT38725.1 5-bromo-4-chloroindolyl phosphate hydrolysis family protein [Gymnodinialimonas ceratoperidinii]
MAKRYGGEFSPSGQRDGETPRETVTHQKMEIAPFRGRKPMRHGAKLNILFILPLLTIFSVLFNSGVTEMAVDLLGGALLMLAAWLTRDGVRAEDAFNERKVARKPAIPRKIFGAVGTGVGVALLILGGSNFGPGALFAANVVGFLAAGLHLFSFGLDPLKNKGMEGMDSFTSDRVARKIDEAEKLLAEQKDAIARVRDPQLEARVARFQDVARGLFRQVEEDPRDLNAARRYLGVYLKGARDATVQFANLYTRKTDYKVRSDYIAFLDDLEQNFAARKETLLIDDRTNFDVEIEVLQDRLNRETKYLERQE